MTGSMLPTVWAVRDVTDVESLCRGVIARQRAAAPQDFSPADFDETLGWLLGEVIVLEARFEQRPGIIFRPWLFQRLCWAVIDHWRSFYGRNGQHRVPPLPPIEGDDDSWDVEQRDPMDDDRSGASRLERVVAEFTVDPPDARDVALRWVLTDGDREALRTQRRLGLEPVGGVTPRVSDADQFLDDVIGELAA